jgi:tungstate transport system permease protein
MDYMFKGIQEALGIILSFDREFLKIIFVSLRVSGTAVTLAAMVAIPFGIFIGCTKFKGQKILITILNTLMALPTVVIGLIVYSLLSRRGPLGQFGFLYTLTAMVIGQFILIFPILAGLSASAVRSLDKRIQTTVLTLGANNFQRIKILLHEARFGIIAAMVAGFGRIFSEIGISMMLGGNIKSYTRNITTSIALETSKGEFALGIALGLVLLSVAFLINILFTQFQRKITDADL